jgi:nucleoside-diphosphate-sugar epimerase
MNKLIACVSGASGIIGARICEQLLSKGYIVRALSRQKRVFEKNIELFNGNIENEKDVEAFMHGAHLLFHCAAEFRDESKMWDINVRGTERLFKWAERMGIKYFCHLSSVGVIGHTDIKLADELTPCNPQNPYEKSKWAAEELVKRGINGCKVIILRPTYVIDERRIGILSMPQDHSFIDLCKVFIKGGECAHIIHAEDVAAAALYFISFQIKAPECYIVSCDHEPLNTVAGVWALYKAIYNKKAMDSLFPIPHLPLIIPYYLRKIIRGRSNMGDVRYSSNKLMGTGFIFKLGLIGAIRRIASVQC